MCLCAGNHDNDHKNMTGKVDEWAYIEQCFRHYFGVPKFCIYCVFYVYNGCRMCVHYDEV